MPKLLLSGILFLLVISSVSCRHNTADDQTISLAINPWPGYEFLYLAHRKGFFEEQGMSVSLHELPSLADVKRVFEQGRVDAMASTIIEAVDAAVGSNDRVEIVLVPDYSFGGDVILGGKGVRSLHDLHGKTVGVEMGGLGTYVLFQAMKSAGIDRSQVQVRHVEQLAAEPLLRDGELDAVVTYQPFSTSMQALPDVAQIFSTREIPEAVIDVVSVRSGVIENPTQWQQKLFRVWQRALDYTRDNPGDAFQIMAERENIAAHEFQQALKGVYLLNADQQPEKLSSATLTANIRFTCELLVRAGTLDTDCNQIHQRVAPLIPR